MLAVSPTNDYFYVKAGGYSARGTRHQRTALTYTDWDGYYANTTFIRAGRSRVKPGPERRTWLADSAFDNDTTALNGTNGNRALVI